MAMDRFATWRGQLEWRDRWAELARRYPEDPRFAELEGRILAHPAYGYHLSATIESSLDALDPDARQAFVYGFLIWQIGHFERRFAESGFPPEIAEHYGDAFHRMFDGISTGDLPFDLKDDLLVKDIALTRLTLIPAASRVLSANAGLPLRRLLKWPLGWSYIWGRCRGRFPFYESHTHDATIDAYFNPAGWEETCRVVALLLKNDPLHNGFTACSWLYDPQLARVSPRLTYLREVPKSQGARFQKIGPDAESARLATIRSPTRRAAFLDGSYMPTRHALTWSRADLLKHYG